MGITLTAVDQQSNCIITQTQFSSRTESGSSSPLHPGARYCKIVDEPSVKVNVKYVSRDNSDLFWIINGIAGLTWRYIPSRYIPYNKLPRDISANNKTSYITSNADLLAGLQAQLANKDVDDPVVLHIREKDKSSASVLTREIINSDGSLTEDLLSGGCYINSVVGEDFGSEVTSVGFSGRSINTTRLDGRDVRLKQDTLLRLYITNRGYRTELNKIQGDEVSFASLANDVNAVMYFGDWFEDVARNAVIEAIGQIWGTSPGVKIQGIDGIYILPFPISWSKEVKGGFVDASISDEIYRPYSSYHGGEKCIGWKLPMCADLEIVDSSTSNHATAEDVAAAIESLDLSAKKNSDTTYKSYIYPSSVRDTVYAVTDEVNNSKVFWRTNSTFVVETGSGEQTIYTWDTTYKGFNVSDTYGYGVAYSRANSYMTAAYLKSKLLSNASASDEDLLSTFPSKTVISASGYVILPYGYFWINPTTSTAAGSITFKDPIGCCFKWDTSKKTFLDKTFSKTAGNVSASMIYYNKQTNQDEYLSNVVMSDTPVMDIVVSNNSEARDPWGRVQQEIWDDDGEVTSSTTLYFELNRLGIKGFYWYYSSPTSTSSPTLKFDIGDQSIGVRSFSWNTTYKCFVDSSLSISTKSVTDWYPYYCNLPIGTVWINRDVVSNNGDDISEKYYLQLPQGFSWASTTSTNYNINVKDASNNTITWTHSSYSEDEYTTTHYWYTDSGKFALYVDQGSVKYSSTTCRLYSSSYGLTNNVSWPSTIAFANAVYPDPSVVLGASISDNGSVNYTTSDCVTFTKVESSFGGNDAMPVVSREDNFSPYAKLFLKKAS